jgi:hypothetical protein
MQDGLARDAARAGGLISLISRSPKLVRHAKLLQAHRAALQQHWTALTPHLPRLLDRIHLLWPHEAVFFQVTRPGRVPPARPPAPRALGFAAAPRQSPRPFEMLEQLADASFHAFGLSPVCVFTRKRPAPPSPQELPALLPHLDIIFEELPYLHPHLAGIVHHRATLLPALPMLKTHLRYLRPYYAVIAARGGLLAPHAAAIAPHLMQLLPTPPFWCVRVPL